ncbi:MAG TPA: hypothetical protein VHU84_13940 [Lacipirellulaceae bacterium]|nr:hypothetical protein [Lacipirellulaceae bacterium]
MFEINSKENTGRTNEKSLNLLPMSSEAWELVENRLWNNIKKKKLWTLIGGTVTILAVVSYLGIPSYIKNQFSDKIDEEVKAADKMRFDIKRQQEEILADEKIFIALLQKYQRDQQAISRLASQIVDEVHQSTGQVSNEVIGTSFQRGYGVAKNIINGIQRNGLCTSIRSIQI